MNSKKRKDKNQRIYLVLRSFLSDQVGNNSNLNFQKIFVYLHPKIKFCHYDKY